MAKKRKASGLKTTFAEFSTLVSRLSGRPAFFGMAVFLVLGWILSGPLFGFSDTWQLVMNTVSSIVTFIMVFIIQNSQTRESEASQAKLDTLIAAIDRADDRYIRLEDLTDEQIEQVRRKHGPRSKHEAKSS